MDRGEIYQQLEDYLDGKLSESEQATIQQRIDTDEEIAELLEMLRLERELGDLMINDQLETKMKKWTEEKETQRQQEGQKTVEESSLTKENKKPFPWIKWLSVLVLLVLVYFYFNPVGEDQIPTILDQPSIDIIDNNGDTIIEKPDTQYTPIPTENTVEEKIKQSPPSSDKPIAEDKQTITSTSQQLALATVADVYPVGEMNFGTKSAAIPDDESDFEKGYRLMGKGQLEDARQALEQIPETEGGLYLNARQYLAYILFEQRKYDKAIPILRSLLDIPYAEESKMRWLLALSHLSIGQEQVGIEEMKKLASNTDNPEYQKLAKNFLNSMK